MPYYLRVFASFFPIHDEILLLKETSVLALPLSTVSPLLFSLGQQQLFY